MRRSLAIVFVLMYATYVGSAYAGFPPTTAAWTRSASSPILSATAAWEQTAVVEANVRWEGGTTWKMWYRGGWANPGLGYATSTDGVSWTKYASNPVYGQGGSGYANSSAAACVFKNGSTYYLYTSGGSSPTDFATTFRVATSTDGIAWTTQTSSITLPAGKTLWGNRAVWIEGATWYLLQEVGTASPPWQIYYYTSSDGLTWSIGNSGNALTSLQVFAGGAYGGPKFALINGVLQPKVGSTYHLWYHAASAAANLPTDIYHATSTDRINWTITPATAVLTHLGGTSFEFDQVAGPMPLTVGTTAYLYFDGDNNVTSTAKIGLATYP